MATWDAAVVEKSSDWITEARETLGRGQVDEGPNILDQDAESRAFLQGEAVHLGRDPRRNGYVIYIPHLNRITTAYHIGFGAEKSFIDPKDYETKFRRAQAQYQEERDKLGNALPQQPQHDPNYQHFTDDGLHFREDHCQNMRGENRIKN